MPNHVFEFSIRNFADINASIRLGNKFLSLQQNSSQISSVLEHRRFFMVIISNMDIFQYQHVGKNFSKHLNWFSQLLEIWMRAKFQDEIPRHNFILKKKRTKNSIFHQCKTNSSNPLELSPV